MMSKLLEGYNKYRLILVLLISAFVLVIVGAVIISNIDFKEKPNGTVATVLNEGDLIINYVDGDVIEFNDSKEHSYGISITNNSSVRLYYSIYFIGASHDVTVKIKDKDGKVINTVDKDLTENKLINLYSIEGGETIRYSITIDSDVRVKFRGTLKVENDSMTTETFSDLILLHNQVDVPTTRIGSEVSTSDEGLLSTIDNKGTSYYFRGAVKNNYVKLGDLLFRIVRINGDGTVRLVLDGVIDKQVPYNTNLLVEGAHPSSLALLSGATVINSLNEWYNNNMSSYNNFIVKGDFCTDTNYDFVLNGTSFSNTYVRIFNDEAPDLYCSGAVYNGLVGLLSADEIVFAGAAGKQPNTSYYLYNSEIKGNYLTSSAYFINVVQNVAMFNVTSNGALGDGILIDNPSYLRPVVNISVNANIKGEGTKSNPYIIVS